MAKRFKGGMHGREVVYHFKNPAMDFFFQWILGGSFNEASTAGECFSTANKIKDGDPQSWAFHWNGLAKTVEARAERSLREGHLVSAREAFFRAFVYYRACASFLSPIQDSNYLSYIENGRRCFSRALSLLDYPDSTISIPYQGKSLPGYFFKPDESGKKRKTLIMIGGGDTIVEDLYFYIVPSAIKRDYNILIVDLPGQGTLPFEGLTWIAETEVPMAKVVDYLLSLPEVDEERLAAFGISGGGYLVPRSVTREKRIKAICACSMILSWEKLWTVNTKAASIAKIENTWLFTVLKTIKKQSFGLATGLLDTYKWRWGVNSLNELIEVSKKMVYDPAEITCPTLIMIGESEYALEYSKYCQDVSMQRIQNPNKKLIVTPIDEGAEGHALGTNIALMSQLLFDWLDSIL